MICTTSRYLAALALLLPALALGADAPAAQQPVDTATWSFPLERAVDGGTLLVYAPQVRSWPDFKRFEAAFAFELVPADGGTHQYGTAMLRGATEVDLATREVHVRDPAVDDVSFVGAVPAGSAKRVQGAVKHRALDVPLDLFLGALADEVLESPPPAGFSQQPPPIHVSEKPALLLFVNGPSVVRAVPGSGLRVVVNANWPVFQDEKSGDYYLLERELWMKAAKLDGKWRATGKIPQGFTTLAANGDHARTLQAAVPPPKTKRKAPGVMYTQEPAELIVLDGEPRLETASGALQYAANTDSPLFKLNTTWYLLVSGRWFATEHLDEGPWRFVSKLPDAFADLPADHPRAAVRASVPGTSEARMAALEASLPTTVTIKPGTEAPTIPDYAGEPVFEPIRGTRLTRGVNTGYDIIGYENRYYLCYAGAWYVSDSAKGPWTAASSVPDEIYTIPPSSPAYHVTLVKVDSASESAIVYEYPESYASGVYVAYGVPWYGTGWYYPPWIYDDIYYPPYWVSYGHGYWYSGAIGAYGSTSVWYGPYGGYSYTQRYNPTTGRYGYTERAWDGDEWASSGESYNPRTGISTETSRYYNADDQRLHSEKSVQRGDQVLNTDRTVDFANGESNVRRETSGGGSSDITRTADNGAINTSGTITSGDGRTATVDGSHTPGSGGTTTVTGSEGGKLASRTDGDGNRATLGKSASGDLYAGRNGNVYRKSDGGWQHYENGGWQPADVPDMPGDSRVGDIPQQRPATTRQGGLSETKIGSSRPSTGALPGAGPRPETTRSPQRESRQLQRDYSARQRGQSQFRQRSMGGMGGGMRRGGGGGFRRR